MLFQQLEKLQILSNMEHFKPSIMLDGIAVHPPGWMYVAGFALGGCEWALKEVATPEFKELVIKYKQQEDAEWINARLDRLFKEIEELKTK